MPRDEKSKLRLIFPAVVFCAALLDFLTDLLMAGKSVTELLSLAQTDAAEVSKIQTERGNINFFIAKTRLLNYKNTQNGM